MRRSTRICRKPPPNRPNHPSFSLKIGSFVTPSGRAALGVGKSTLREERARRALLFSKTGGCFPLKSLNPYSRAASAAMTTLPDFDISCGSEYNEAIARPENLGVSWLASILSPPGIFAMTDLDLSVAVGPDQIDTTATLYGLKSCAISNVSLSRPALVAP